VTSGLRRLTPVVLLATGACATKGDIRILQNDLQVMRVESAQADSTRKRQLDAVIAALGISRDSILVVSKRLAKFQGDAAGELYALGQQLIQVQELSGQSQRRLQELRASLEERAQQVAAPPPPVVGGTDAGGGAATPTPGPNQLFQLALDQLRRGSTGAARLGFADLLKQYPTSDVAPDAQFYVAESYAQEGNRSAADSAYALVVGQYPKSPRAPTALYKRARILQAAGNNAAAKAALNQVIRDYPRSDEAALAREQLRTLK
jgi:tol-pal system protein YbgF